MLNCHSCLNPLREVRWCAPCWRWCSAIISTHQDAALRRGRGRGGRVKDHCILRGLAWEGTLAATACSEQEYYEDLLAFYRQIYRASSPL